MGKKRLIFQEQSDTESQKTPLISQNTSNSNLKNYNFQTPQSNSSLNCQRTLNFQKKINIKENQISSHHTVEGQYDILNEQSQQLASYNKVLRSEMDSCKLDKILLRQQRKDQWKYMQNTFYLVITLNVAISVLYIVNVFLYFWYYFDLDEQFDENNMISKISVSFLYVYIYADRNQHEDYYGANWYSKAREYCNLIKNSKDVKNCQRLLSDFQILGIISISCVLIGIILSFVHNKRMYNLSKGYEVGFKGRYVFFINSILFSEPPLSYLLYVLIMHNKFDFSNSHFGWCFYSCSGIMILFIIFMVYYKNVKRKKDENDIMDKLLFESKSSLEQQILQK